jgi:sec-independent protein translocase protein TatB
VFNLQGSEIIIVLLLALVVLGPEKLPDAMRKMGQAFAELKKMSAGFQSEFRAAVDEPMREVRQTANALRDSADFTKLQHGDRQEKPKSADMAVLAPGDPDAVPTADAPTFETPLDPTGGPEVVAESKPAPYADDASDGAPDATPDVPGAATDPTRGRGSAVPAPPPPFTAMSAALPADDTADDTTVDTTDSADDAGGTSGDPRPVGDPASDDDETDPTR